MSKLERFLVADYEPGTRGAETLCTFCDSLPVYTLRSSRRIPGTTVPVRYALCVVHGAPHFEPTLSFLVPGSDGAEYELHYPPDGPWSCTCESFKYSRSLPIGVEEHGTAEDLRASLGWCKHLERKRREIAGLPDLTDDGKYCEGCSGEWRRGECSCAPIPVAPDA